MVKDINEYLVLNKEEQILVNKLNKNLSFLAEKTAKYFQQEKIISSDMVRDGFIYQDDYLTINQDAINLINNWEENVKTLKITSKENSEQFKNEIFAKSFISNEVINKNLAVVLNTIDNLGNLYLKKDKIKVLNQLKDLYSIRENGYSQDISSILEKYEYSLMILKQILEDNQLVALATNNNDLLLLTEIDNLENRWKIFDNKQLLIKIAILSFIMIISIIAICVIVIIAI